MNFIFGVGFRKTNILGGMMKWNIIFVCGGGGGSSQNWTIFGGSYLYILGLFLTAMVQNLNILGGAKF